MKFARRNLIKATAEEKSRWLGRPGEASQLSGRDVKVGGETEGGGSGVTVTLQPLEFPQAKETSLVKHHTLRASRDFMQDSIYGTIKGSI